MSSQVIDPDYQWKQAAAQEGVDYDAVQKSFMDQAYGIVANKAKILFQDPFRLGFEIVHRNEKATKMVGIFAFRVNKELLYAPVFFVNGEIKAADMLYCSKTKRFVPLTEDWCAYRVRGVTEGSGDPVDKGRQRQADAYMDRLAYPQRTKYASEVEFVESHLAMSKAELISTLEKQAGKMDAAKQLLKYLGVGAGGATVGGGVGYLKGRGAGFEDGSAIGSEEAMRNLLSGVYAKMLELGEAGQESPLPEGMLGKEAKNIFRELMLHCADDEPLRKLVPVAINEGGPEALEKLAGLIADSTDAQRFVVENYSEDELKTVDAWMAKEAATEDPEAGSIVIVTDPRLAKSASSRDEIMSRGYDLIDKRPEGATNVVIEEISGDGTIKELKGTCAADVMLEGGKLERAAILALDHALLHDPGIPMTTADAYARDTKPDCVYFPKTKEMIRLNYDQPVFGEDLLDEASGVAHCGAKDLATGKTYAMIATERMCVSSPFQVKSKAQDGEATVITTCGDWGDERKLTYTPDRERSEGRYISDDARFIEVSCDVEKRDNEIRNIEPKCEKVLMNEHGIDQWMRTAGGLTTSSEVTVSPTSGGNFDLIHKVAGELVKVSRDLGWLEAHLTLAEDWSMRCDKAGEILEKARDNEVSYRVYDSITKSGYMTRQEGMEDWVQSYDPELQVRLDAPQQQVLSTFTPRRQSQVQRYGDTFQRSAGGFDGENRDGAEDPIPKDALLNSTPEQLAQMSQAYDMPHIFDHECLGQMSTTSFNVNEQIKQYIPDLEQGLDRIYRVLFLLRYRPADFEESYGKDALLEMEQELSEWASQSGENLLRLLKRFDDDQYDSQIG